MIEKNRAAFLLAICSCVIFVGLCYLFFSRTEIKENISTETLLSVSSKQKSLSYSSFAVDAPDSIVVERAVDLYEDKTGLHQEHLDREIDESPEDLSWQFEVQMTADNIFIEWPDAEVRNVRCSQSVCRIEFLAGLTENIEGIMNDLNNMQNIQGERMINISGSPPHEAIAYLGRTANSLYFDN